MADVGFLLKEPKGKKETPLNLYLYYGAKKPIKYATGIKINPAYWNANKHELRDKRDVEFSAEINKKIETLAQAAKRVYINLSAEGEFITPERFREELDYEVGKRKRKGVISLYEYLDSFIGKITDRREKNKFSALKKYLIDFSKESRIAINYDTVTPAVARDFTMFLNNRTTKFGNKMKKNAVSTQVEALRKVLRRSFEDGITAITHYRSNVFSVDYERVPKETLTEGELLAIFNVKLHPKYKLWDRGRDVFIIGACTFMRYSDYSKLRKEYIEDGYFLKMTQKTSTPVKIPVHPMVREIMKKYNGNFPPPITNSNLNRVIKLVAKAAGITHDIVLSHTVGGVRKEVIVPKWKTITTHSARKSGATILRKQGVPIEDIQRLLGHSRIETTMNYLYSDIEDTAQRVESIPFFSGKVS